MVKTEQDEKELDYFEESQQDEEPSSEQDVPLPETDNKRWELDEEPVLASLRYELKKRLNARGVEDVIGWFRMVMNKGSALTNLELTEIQMITVTDIEALNDELRENNKLWGVKSAAARTTISRWVEDKLFTQLKRAYKDGERKYRKESYGYNENYNHNEVGNDEIGSRGFKLWPFGGKKKQQQPQQQFEDERF